MRNHYRTQWSLVSKGSDITHDDGTMAPASNAEAVTERRAFVPKSADMRVYPTKLPHQVVVGAGDPRVAMFQEHDRAQILFVLLRLIVTIKLGH